MKVFFSHLLLVISTQFAFSQSHGVIDSLKLVLKNTSNDSTKMVLMNRISWQYAFSGRHDLQLEYARAIIKMADKIKNKHCLGLGFYCLGGYYNSIGNYDKAIFNTTRALQLFRECDHRLGIASAFLKLGDYQYSHHKTEAIENYEKASGLFQELGQLSDVAVIENTLGLLYFDLNNYSQSLKHIALSLKFSEHDEDKEGLINPLNLYRMQGYYDEILQLYLNKLHKFEKSGYTTRVPNIKIVIGNIYNEKGDYEKAIQYLSNGMVSFSYKQPVTWLPGYEGLAKAYLMKIRGHQHDGRDTYFFINAAFVNARNALELARGLRDNAAAQQCTILLAQAFLARAKYSHSKDDFMNALTLLREIKPVIEKYREKILLRDVYVSMSEIYAELGDYEQAFQFSSKASQIKDSIVNDETAIKIEKLRMQFEIEKAVNTERVTQQKILYEEKILHQNAIAEQKRNESRLLALKEARANRVLMVSLSLFLTIIFAVLLLRQRSAKNRALERADTLRKMTELELQSLRAQLNPHFMFNSLNAIQELILMEDNENSHVYLSRFSELLRMLLDNANQPFISLRKELHFLELYLSLENLRIPDLEYVIEVDPKIDSEKTLIPNMMLQPYIENAIWHGLSHKKQDKLLRLKVHQNGESILFEVEDNGIGRKRATELKSLYRKEHKSKGMELLSKRFSLLSKEYGAHIQATVTDLTTNGQDAGGTLVEVSVPLSLSEKANQAIYDTSHYN